MDTPALLAVGFQNVLVAWGRPSSPQSTKFFEVMEARRKTGNPFFDCARELGLNKGQALAAVDAAWMDAKPVPRTMELVARMRLETPGMKLWVATDDPPVVANRFLQKMGNLGAWSGVFCPEMAGMKWKDDPSYWKAFFAVAGKRPDECALIDDAKSAGAHHAFAAAGGMA